MATVVHPNQIERTRKHARLKQPKKEPASQQSTVVLHNPLHHGREAEEEHIHRQPDVRAKPLHEDVTGDLEDDVGYEEDDERDVVLVAREVEFFGQAVDVCVGDVDAV